MLVDRVLGMDILVLGLTGLQLIQIQALLLLRDPEQNVCRPMIIRTNSIISLQIKTKGITHF